MPFPPSNFTRSVTPFTVTFITTPSSSPLRICGFFTISKLPLTTGLGKTIAILPIK